MKRNALTVFARLFSLVGNFVFVLLLAVINGTIGNLCAISITVLGSIGVMKFLGVTISLSYSALMILIVTFGFLRGILRYIEQYFNHYIAFKLLYIIREKVFSALQVLCPAKLETKQKGTLISMITADIETLEVFYAHTLSPLMIAFLVMICTFFFSGFFLSFYIAFYLLCCQLLIGFVFPLIGNRLLNQKGAEYRQAFGTFSGYFLDCIKGTKNIVLFGKQEKSIQQIDTYSQKMNHLQQKVKSRNSLFLNGIALFLIILDVLFLLLGLALIQNTSLQAAQLIVALVLLLSGMGPFLALSNLPGSLNQTIASGNRILNLLEETPAVEEITEGQDFDFHSLQIKNLSFRYQDQRILSNLNLSVQEGEIIGIKGPSGCGKSTLLKLLLRFYDKDDGEILYNGQDIRKYRTSALKNNVCLVSQNTYLFEDTIRNNLLIAKENATDEEIFLALKKAAVLDLVMSLENKLDTIVKPGIFSLSAGEKQRIGLARAFLSSAKLILLDEVTSNVDSINEGIILQALKKNRDKTYILVSHRDSTMSICDHVYSFKEINHE